MAYIINDNGTDRPMTVDEQEAYEATAANVLANVAERQAEQTAIESKKQSAKTKLKALGLTDAEIAALVG